MSKIYEVETKTGHILRRYEVTNQAKQQSGTAIAENPASACRQCGWLLEECEVKSVPFYMAQIGDSKPIIKQEVER